MFKDTKEALKRFEEALREEDTTQILPQVPQQPEEIPPEQEGDTFSLDEIKDLLEDTQVIGNTSQYRNHANDYGGVDPRRVSSGDKVDAEELSQQLLEDTPQGSITGLAICAGVLAVGILCVVVWWIARYWGVL